MLVIHTMNQRAGSARLYAASALFLINGVWARDWVQGLEATPIQTVYIHKWGQNEVKGEVMTSRRIIVVHRSSSFEGVAFFN